MTTLDFTVLWKDRGAARGLQQLGQHAGKASSNFQHLNQQSAGLGSRMGSMAKGGVAAVGVGLAAAGVAAIGYGVKVVAANENAQIAFTTMLGSGQKAEKFLGRLRDFAAKTPFEFPELTKAAQSLISVGVKANDVIPIMTTLGNVTSGMGTGAEGVQRATVALQQMQAAGRITAEDLNQLRDAGIPLNALFAGMSEKTGISSKKLFEMSRNGKLGREELDALMETLRTGEGFERFNGMMDKQSKSLNGMLSTLKDTFGQGMAKAIEPALPFIKGAIGSITKAVGDMFSWLATHQEQFVVGIIDTGNAVFGLAMPFLHLHVVALKVLADIGDGLANILEGMDKLAPGDQFSGTVTSLRNFAAGARTAGAAINDDLIPKINAAHEKWNAFGKDQRTKAALRDANQVIVRAVQKTDDSLKANGKTLDSHTEKGKNNRSALRNLADSQKAYREKLIATGAKTKDVDKYTEESRKTFIKTAVKMGATKEQAQRLADKYGLLDRKINGLNNKKVTISFGTGSYSIGGVKYKVNLTSPSSVGRSATGGLIKGRGTGTSDSILGVDTHGWPTTRVSDGEFVVNAKSTARYRAELEAINKDGLAVGGIVHPVLGDIPRGAMTAPNTASRFGDKIAVAMGKELGKTVGARLSLPSGGPAGSAIATGGWASIYRVLRAVGARRFTTYPGHDQGPSRSRDITPPSQRIADTARRLSSIWYVIYNRRIASKNHGNVWRPYTRYGANATPSQAHTNHVHVTLRSGVRADRGGMLESGGWATNISGQPERVLSPTQTKDFHQLVKVLDRRGSSATAVARPININVDLGDNVVHRIQGVLDENDAFHASVGRMYR